jgi:hypothetical protein
LAKKDWATFWATFSRTHPVTLAPVKTSRECVSIFLQSAGTSEDFCVKKLFVVAPFFALCVSCFSPPKKVSLKSFDSFGCKLRSTDF